MTPPTRPTTRLSPRVRAFLDADRFASIATVDPDGGPRQAVVWYTLDGDDIILNSAVGRRWPANLVRDGRISLAIADGTDGYHWVGITGTIEVVDDQPTAQADIAAMARRYHADEPDEAEAMIRDRFEQQSRISFRVHPDAVHEHLD